MGGYCASENVELSCLLIYPIIFNHQYAISKAYLILSYGMNIA